MWGSLERKSRFRIICACFCKELKIRDMPLSFHQTSAVLEIQVFYTVAFTFKVSAVDDGRIHGFFCKSCKFFQVFGEFCVES